MAKCGGNDNKLFQRPIYKIRMLDTVKVEIAFLGRLSELGNHKLYWTFTEGGGGGYKFMEGWVV